MKHNNINRRLFLRGAGGTILSIPLLPSLLTSFISDAQAEEFYGNEVGAYIFIRTYFGAPGPAKALYETKDPEGNNWTIVPSKYDSNNILMQGEYRFKELAMFKDKNLSKYLDDSLYRNDLEEYASIILGDSSFLNCGHVNSSVLTACRSREENLFTPPRENISSIDVILQKHFEKSNSSLIPIRVKNEGAFQAGHTRGSFSFEHKGNGEFIRNDFIEHPIDLYNQLIKISKPDLQSGMNSNEQMKKGVIDFVYEQFKSLRSKVSPEDKILLDEYAENAQKLSMKLEERLISGQQVTNNELNSCKDFSTPPSTKEQLGATKAFDYFSDLITMAIACGMTRVVCVDLPHYQDFGSDVSGQLHDLAHQKWEEFTKKLKYNRDQVYLLANKLKSQIGPTGKNLLETSLIYHTSESAWGHLGWEGGSIMMLGKGNGKVNSGFAYDYRWRTDNQKGGWFYQTKVGRGGRQDLGMMGWTTKQALLESMLKISNVPKADYLPTGSKFFGEMPNEYIPGSNEYFNDYEASILKSFHTDYTLTLTTPGVFKKT